MNWWKSLVSLAVAAVSIFTPQLQGAIAAHPAISASIASAFAIWSHLSASPLVDTSGK